MCCVRWEIERARQKNKQTEFLKNCNLKRIVFHKKKNTKRANIGQERLTASTRTDFGGRKCNHNWSPSRLNLIVSKRDKSCATQETFSSFWLLCLRRAVASEESEEKTNLPRVTTLINYVTIPFTWSHFERRSTTPRISCYYYNIGVKSWCRLHRSAVHDASHFSLSWEKLKKKTKLKNGNTRTEPSTHTREIKCWFCLRHYFLTPSYRGSWWAATVAINLQSK